MGYRRGWHSRGHLPHADFSGLVQAVTFRLADALPENVLDRLKTQGSGRADHEQALFRKKLHDYLDSGHGSCLLAAPEARQAVEAELRKHDGSWYVLLASAIMPNHVHALIEVHGVSLAKIVKTWKGALARSINTLWRRTGQVWQKEYHDRFIRDEVHLNRAIEYIRGNPEAAGLAQDHPGVWIRHPDTAD
jgi:REP element-mobilizing transposase RayT